MRAGSYILSYYKLRYLESKVGQRQNFSKLGKFGAYPQRFHFKERVASDKRSSLFGPFISFEDKSFVTTVSGTVFTLHFPHYLRMDSISKSREPFLKGEGSVRLTSLY